MDAKKFNALKNIRKRDVIIFLIVALVSFLSAFLLPNPQEVVDSDTLKYLGSALIQSFAALIAIPFAFYSSYLHSRYGYPGLQFAISRVKKYIFPPFALLCVLSVALILFPNYPGLPKISFSYDSGFRVIVFGEFLVSGILLYIIYLHLIEVMSVTPLKLAQEIVEKEENKRSYVSVDDILDKFKMVSELLIISLKDPTLQHDSEGILKQLLELLEKYPPDDDSEISTEVTTLNQILERLNSIIDTLEKTGPIVSLDAIENLVETLGRGYTDLLMRHHKELSDITQENLAVERIHRLHGAFYDILTRLSMVYSTNFFKIYYSKIFKEYILSQDDVQTELILTLIMKTRTYLKHAEYLDQEEAIPGTPRTLAAISGIDFIFDLLNKLKEETLFQLLLSSEKELIEIMEEIKLLLLPRTQTNAVPFFIISGERKPIYIDDKNVILNVLSAWTGCILNITEKIVEYTQNEQNLDHAPAVESSKEVFDQVQETEQHFTGLAKQFEKTFERLNQLSKYIMESSLLTHSSPGSTSEPSKNPNPTEWILKDILIENIVELYEVFECSLTFEPESKIVVLGVKKLGIWRNIGIDSEKFKEIYDYLQSTKLQKYLKWKEKTDEVHSREKGVL